MRRVISGIMALGTTLALLPIAASARPTYPPVFKEVYKPKAGGTLDKAGCGICHIADKPKTERNPYGAEIAKALKAPNATPADLTVALKKVEKMKTADKKTTYGDLIKMDKLPGGAPAPAK